MWHLLPDPARKRTEIKPDLVFNALFPLNKRTPTPLHQLAWCLPGSTHSRKGSSYYDLSCLKAFQQASMVDWKLPLNSNRDLSLAFQEYAGRPAKMGPVKAWLLNTPSLWLKSKSLVLWFSPSCMNFKAHGEQHAAREAYSCSDGPWGNSLPVLPLTFTFA